MSQGWPGVTNEQVPVLLQRMALLQDGLNQQVNQAADGHWHDAGHPYYRAVWVECAELLDHFGWKWWKHQQVDLPQVKLEVVDIWHFGLSDMLRAGTLAVEKVPETVVASFTRKVPAVDFRQAIEALAAQTLRLQSFPLSEFVTLMVSLPMDLRELYQLYVGKNVLNGFRQDHGYQDGSYRKRWSGRDDNEHLEALAGQLDVTDARFPERLYQALEQSYEQGRA